MRRAGEFNRSLERRIEDRPQVCARAFQISRAPKAPADYYPPDGIIGEADARHEVGPHRVIESAAVAILPRNLYFAGLQVHVCFFVIDFVDRLVPFPAQSKVDRQVRTDLPVVLRKEGIAPLALSDVAGHGTPSHGHGMVHVEVGQAVTLVVWEVLAGFGEWVT